MTIQHSTDTYIVTHNNLLNSKLPYNDNMTTYFSNFYWVSLI